MKTIYNTFVVMQDQSQCDRMKHLCIDNGLDYWEHYVGFSYRENLPKVFEYDSESKRFYCNSCNIEQETEITEQEFIELLKTTKQ